ncbi:hypothetical protein [Pseudoalteromonas distincta]|nr:hypothetical protein [Pseudoalteromonas distincta]
MGDPLYVKRTPLNAEASAGDVNFISAPAHAPKLVGFVMVVSIVKLFYAW